jgi:TonB family protein
MSTVPIADVHLGATAQTLPIANAERVMASLRPAFRNCFGVGLTDDPTMTGAVVLDIGVGADGAVHSVDVLPRGGSVSPPVAACVRRAAQRAQFDPPGSNARMTTPIHFGPRQ